MSKITYLKCDFCKSKDSVKELEITVVFDTEQNEGRSTAPYLENTTLDTCKKCLQRIIDEHILPSATGAMGFNTYALLTPASQKEK